MTVYIAGPISSDPDYEKKFKEREMLLKNAGHQVMNPATIGKEIEKFYRGVKIKHSTYMKFLLPYLCRADAISMLDGWEKSEGAKFEFETAKICEIPIIEIKPLPLKKKH